MLEQVSLLSNKMQHLKLCKTLRTLRLDKRTIMFFEEDYIQLYAD